MKREKIPENEKKYIGNDGSYLLKVDGFYKMYTKDGKEVTGVNLPINIGLSALKGSLPPFVSYYPSDSDIAIEPELEQLRKKLRDE